MRIQWLVLPTEPICRHGVVVRGKQRIEILAHLLYDSIKAKWYTHLTLPRYAPFLDGY